MSIQELSLNEIQMVSGAGGAVNMVGGVENGVAPMNVTGMGMQWQNMSETLQIEIFGAARQYDTAPADPGSAWLIDYMASIANGSP